MVISVYRRTMNIGPKIGIGKNLLLHHNDTKQHNVVVACDFKNCMMVNCDIYQCSSKFLISRDAKLLLYNYFHL